MPRKSLTQRKAGLELSLARSRGLRAEAVSRGADFAATKAIDAQIAELERRLARVSDDLASTRALARRADQIAELRDVEAEVAALSLRVTDDQRVAGWLRDRAYLSGAGP